MSDVLDGDQIFARWSQVIAHPRTLELLRSIFEEEVQPARVTPSRDKKGGAA